MIEKSSRNQLREHIKSTLIPFRWDLLGFGLSRAQTTALLAFAANEIWISGASFAVQEAMFLAAATVALAIGMFAKRRTESTAPVSVVGGFLMIGVLGIASIIIGKLDESSILLIVGFLLAGASAGFFETSWGPKFVGLPQAGIQLYTLFAMAVSSIFGIILSFLPTNGFYLASLVLLGSQAALLLVHRNSSIATENQVSSEKSTSASAAYILRSDTHVSSSPSPKLSGPESPTYSKRDAVLMVRTILATTLIFSLIYNTFITLAYSSLPSDAASQIRFWANLVATCMIICSFLLLRPMRSTTLFQLVLPVVTLGFVLFLLSPTLLGKGALMASSIGRKFFDIFVWVIIAEAVSLSDFGVWRAFGLLAAAKNAGYGISLFAAHAVLAAVNANIVQVTAIVAVLILGLVVLLAWFFPEWLYSRQLSISSTPIEPLHTVQASTFEASVARVAERGHLTPREREVMDLLAHGRNIPAIAEKLCISKGTAHTHATHVYQKLGLHRQQELIELIDHEKDKPITPDQSDD